MIRNVDKIKYPIAFVAGQHPVRDAISVENGCIRETERAVRYAIFFSTVLPSLTGRRANVGTISLSTDILSLTGHPRLSVIFVEKIILFMLLKEKNES